MLLTLLFKSLEVERLNYYISEGETEISRGETTILELQHLTSTRDITKIHMIIPGELVSSFVVTLPKGSKRHAKQALPYLIEDELASSVESMHITSGQADSEKKVLVLAINKQQMSTYTNLGQQLSLPVTKIIPDYLLIPTAGKTQILELDQKTLIRFSNGTGLSLPSENNHDLISTIDAIQIEPEHFSHLLFSKEDVLTVNLLQGDFQSTAGFTENRWIKPLTVSAILSTVLILIYFLAAGFYFQAQTKKLDEEAITLYQQLFPNDQRIVNIQRQMKGHLRKVTSTQPQSSFLNLLSELSEGLSKTEDSRMTITHLQFDQKNNSLIAELNTQSITSTGRLQQHIKDRGFNADILSVNKNGNSIVARIKLGKKP